MASQYEGCPGAFSEHELIRKDTQPEMLIWDYARIINMTRGSFDAEYLSREEALDVMSEINAMSHKSKYPFITVKDMAAYLKINQWRIQHYFYTCMNYEYFEMRERHRRNK